ncbi:hypothetical protein VPNG_08707 [Cytospora leucostoma]|uniref:tRNA pseudouridine synthase 1 n=1 Tax=Cytospora leucostoma TaxID=1230097 RepID=A0A423W2D9_9PEZI|nr:hypothetical protein VPNG_08707 [Cytospora leucostoma]
MVGTTGAARETEVVLDVVDAVGEVGEDGVALATDCSRGGHGLKTDRRAIQEDKRQRRDDDGNADATAEDGEEKQSKMNIKFSAEEIAQEDRRPKRKVAVLIGYAGTGYKGMQINHHEKTIEGDLFAAFVAAGAIAKTNADDPKKSSFVRCARTDKGVHAAGNVISLKLVIEEPDIVQKINEKLPEQIRVWGLQRTNNAFNCYQACDSRWYEYLLPSYSLLPPSPKSFLGKKVIEAAQEKGVYDKVQKTWGDVKDFWDEVEKNDIQPILERLDEKTREEVLRMMQASEEGEEQPEDDETDLATSKKRKADEEPEVPAKKNKVEGTSSEETTAQNPESVETKTSGTEAVEASQAEVAANGDAMEVDVKPVDTTAASAEASTETSEGPKTTKPKYQPSPAEIAFREVKAAYIAAKRRYRVTPERVQQLQAALSMYEGTNNFHNYTIQKTFKDPSAKRHIKSFQVNPKPIQIRDTEWLSLKVHGQSFMMHQIRKMVAMAVLCVRCATPLELMKQSYGPKRISIPKAPGLGLLLERPVFESYSRKAQASFDKEPLDFSKYEKEIEEFKQKQIYNRIWDTEEAENSFHIFFHQLDNFDTDYFLWATAHGLDAAHEPKERRDPKNPVPKALQEEEGDDDPEGGEG